MDILSEFEKELLRLANYHPNPSREHEVEMMIAVISERINDSKILFEEKNVNHSDYDHESIYATIRMAWHPDRYGENYNSTKYLDNYKNSTIEISPDNFHFRIAIGQFMLNEYRKAICKIVGADIKERSRLELFIKELGIENKFIDFIIWVILPRSFDQFLPFDKHASGNNKAIDELRKKLLIFGDDVAGSVCKKSLYDKIGSVIDYRLLDSKEEALYKSINAYFEKIERNRRILLIRQLLEMHPQTFEDLLTPAGEIIKTDEFISRLNVIKRKNLIKKVDISEVQVKSVKLKELKNRIIVELDCKLKRTAINLVFGSGNENAKVLIVGEAPGEVEDLRGAPFCGRSGDLLTEMLNSIGINRDQVYITNILKYRPPGNRNPLYSEIESHSPYLLEQIEIIKPNYIVSLGKFASQFICANFNLSKVSSMPSMTRLNGRKRIVSYNGVEMIVFPLFHPSYVLRDQESRLDNYYKSFKALGELIS